MPILTIIAGPNGAGKSTITRLTDFEGRERLLDPDAIARGMNPLNPVAAALPAGRETLRPNIWSRESVSQWKRLSPATVN